MRSIRMHLLAWVLGALNVGAVLLLLVSYLIVLEEMNEVFDENLKQVALAVTAHRDPASAMPPKSRVQLPRLERIYDSAGDFDVIVLTWTRDGARRFTSGPDVQLPFSTTNGVKTIAVNGVDWHVYTVATDEGVVQAAQRGAERKTLAAEVAVTMVLPLALLVGLIGILLVVALRGGLQPLHKAAASVAARSATSLAPIGEADMPREIHPLIRAINGLMGRLAQAFLAQRQFVADAAHELRTPVTALRLQLQLLERSKDEAARIAAIDALRAGIDRSQHLIEQLLQLSRVEPEAVLQHSEPVDLAALARQVVGALTIKAEAKGVDLGADAQAGIAVHGNPHQLGVLLSNLVENALRHTPRGGVVDVKACCIGNTPALQVIDNGPGIPEAERERVFDRFYRGENAEPGHDGSGLGLAIVKAIAERHHASVTLHTPPSGQGLEVCVLFAPD